ETAAKVSSRTGLGSHRAYPVHCDRDKLCRSVVLVVCRVDLRKFDQPSIRETGGIIHQVDEFASPQAQRRRSRRSGSIRRPDGVQIETEKRVQRPAVIDKFFPYAVLYFLLDVILRPEQFEADAVHA